MYSNCCCSCSFKAEIIKIGQSSHNMYSNNILNFQESTTILNAHTKKVWKLIMSRTRSCHYIQIDVHLLTAVPNIWHPYGNSVLMTAHLSPPAYSKNSLRCGVLSTVTYPQSNDQAELAVKTTKRIVNGNTGCPSYLAVPKLPNPRYWPFTSPTPTPLPTL